MVTYPIHVTRSGYRGKDARKRAKATQDNRDAALIENAVNELLLKQATPFKVYLWGEVSNASGVDYETVKRLGHSIDGGSNGFTATRPGLSPAEYEQALGN